MMKVTGRVMTGVMVMGCVVGLAAGEKESPKVAWEVKVFTGYSKAVKEGKLLVVYFRKDFCETCKGPCQHCAVIDGIVRGKEVAALADKAVWVWQSEGRDDAKKNVQRLASQLKIESYPAVVVLEVSEKALTERGRVVGALSKEKFLEQLRPLLTQKVGK